MMNVTSAMVGADELCSHQKRREFSGDSYEKLDCLLRGLIHF